MEEKIEKLKNITQSFPVSSYFTSSRNYESEKRDILNELINNVREVQIKYSGKRELCTEHEIR